MRIALVGAGIGGLAAARFMLRAGIDVMVYEQAPALGEVGAGIQVGPNAVRLLHRLGLAERLQKTAVLPEYAWEFRRWKDGEVLFRQPRAWPPGASLHRYPPGGAVRPWDRLR